MVALQEVTVAWTIQVIVIRQLEVMVHGPFRPHLLDQGPHRLCLLMKPGFRNIRVSSVQLV